MTSKLSDKDKKDWQSFLNSSEKLQSKDEYKLHQQTQLERSIDLHGYTLQEANKEITKFIDYCYQNKVKKITIITGKGMRSKNLDDPYQSSDLSILKHSVPEYIKNSDELMSLISQIKEAENKDGGSGAFYVYLKKKL